MFSSPLLTVLGSLGLPARQELKLEGNIAFLCRHHRRTECRKTYTHELACGIQIGYLKQFRAVYDECEHGNGIVSWTRTNS